MRFCSIGIPSYGPFTNFDLTLDKSSGHDLHLVYGPNEAGKSSLLRGIKHLLYGIPKSTPDNFLHRYTDLQLGATIERSTGEQLSFMRYKRQKNALQDKNGEVIPESTLQEFLGTTDEGYFSGFFGLNAESLHQGAAQLLDAEGTIGETLFSVNAGGTGLNGYLAALEHDCLLYTSPSPRDATLSRMPSSA